MERRFFVTIFARDKSALEVLQRLELDIFGLSKRPRGESSMGGLITETDIEHLRKSGFRVEVHEEYVEQASIKKAGNKGKLSIPVMDDKAWLKDFNRRKKVQ